MRCALCRYCVRGCRQDIAALNSIQPPLCRKPPPPSSVPTLWTTTTTLRYRTVTEEARGFGLDALQRGEVRRRAGVRLYSREGCRDEADLDVATPGMRLHTLKFILHEEVEGCRAWADVADGARHEMSLVLGGGEMMGGGKGKGRAEEVSAIRAAMTGDVRTGKGRNYILLLLSAVAAVSTVLNHLRPLCWVVNMSSGLSLASEEELFLVLDKLFVDDNIVSCVLAEVLVPMIISLHTPDCMRQRHYDAILKTKRERALMYTNAVEDVLERDEFKPEFIISSFMTGGDLCGNNNNNNSSALHMVTERELVQMKSYFQRKLRDHVAVITQLHQSSVDHVKQFKETYEMHQKANVISNPFSVFYQRHGRSSLVMTPRNNNDNNNNNNAAVQSVDDNGMKQSSVLSVDTKRILNSRTPLSPTNTMKETRLSASCWECTVLEIWKARREAVVTVLQEHCFIDNNNNNNNNNGTVLKGEEQGEEVIEGGKKDMRRQLKDRLTSVMELLPGKLSRQLHHLLGACNLDPIHLLDALQSWIKREKDAVDEEMYTMLVLEFVVFLLAAKSLPTNGHRNVLPEVMRFLKHLTRDKSQEGDFSSCLQALPDALMIFLINIIFVAEFTDTSSHSMQSSCNVVYSHQFCSHLSTLLWELHSPCALQYVMSILHDATRQCDGTTCEKSEELSVLLLLMGIVKYGRRNEKFKWFRSSKQSSLFLLTVLELLTNTVLMRLRDIPVRLKRPLPRFLDESLWNIIIPLIILSLQHAQCIQKDCGTVAICRPIELGQLLVEEITPRWEYSFVPARRREKKNKEWNIFSLITVEERHKVSSTTVERVVKFASLLGGLLRGASHFFPHILPDGRCFSRMCNAVGAILHDVDDHTSHEIITHLLRLVPPNQKMDVEAHMSLVRCLSYLRHGCVFWEEAVRHYRRAVQFVEGAGMKSPFTLHRRSHVPSDLSTARVLRCVGSSPLPHESRCVLTLKLAAFALASGVVMNAQSYSSCLLNFTLRKDGDVKMFTGAPWCDALEWYNDVMPHIKQQQNGSVQQDFLCFQMTCIQSLLAEGNWPEALLSHPLADIVRDYGDQKELNLTHFTGKLSFLLRICAADRTRSCAAAANSLLQVIQSSPPSLPSTTTTTTTTTSSSCTLIDELRQTMHLKQLQHVCEIANTIPPVHFHVKGKTNVPLFQHEAPLISRPPISSSSLKDEGEWMHCLHACGFSAGNPHCAHDALVAKLEETVLPSCEQTTTSGIVDYPANDDNTRPRLVHVRVRERVSGAFPFLQTVWSADDFLQRSRDATSIDGGGETGDAARARMDTCYASVIVPLRRLERLRAEKKNLRQRSDLSPQLDGGIVGERK